MRNCQNKACKSILTSANSSKQIIRTGYYYRKSDKKYIRRYLCKACGKTFTKESTSSFFGQKRRDINQKVLNGLNSGESQRKLAYNLGVNPKTIARKLNIISDLIDRGAFKEQVNTFLNYKPIKEVQMDEMETFEHTKMKQVSIPLMVEKEHRFILFVDACKMPTKGPLTKKALIKYGKISDDREDCMTAALERVKPYLEGLRRIETDKCPRYPKVIEKVLGDIEHIVFKGRRGCVVGQGEMKAGGFDPLFSLNHTAAMIRYCVSRLIRKTWCTTKALIYLKKHLNLYAFYHNQKILRTIGLKEVELFLN